MSFDLPLLGALRQQHADLRGRREPGGLAEVAPEGQLGRALGQGGRRHPRNGR